MVISTNRIAPVASVLPSRATASFPPARFSAMIPEPITVANRKKEPSPSAASRRASGGRSGKAGLQWRQEPAARVPPAHPQHFGAETGASIAGAQQLAGARLSDRVVSAGLSP